MRYIETKTLAQIVEEGYEFPEIIPASLRNSILDWYEKRKVSDDDNFARYFNRVLNKDYHHYNELLRIEAGGGISIHAGYDWLVNNYLEKQVKARTNNQQTIDGLLKKTGTQKDTEKPWATNQVTKETTYGSTVDFTHGHTIEYDPHSHRFTYRGAYQETGNAKNKAVSSGSANATATAKTTPASVLGTYNDGTISNAGLTNNETEVFAQLGQTTAWDAELSSPTSISKNASNNIGTSAGISDTVNGFEQIEPDESYGAGTDETRNSGTDTTERGGKDTIVTSEYKRGTNENETEYNISDKRDDVINNNGNSTIQEIHSGRFGENMADALSKARDYIEQTDAFEWLRKQLEPCFMAVYDV